MELRPLQAAAIDKLRRELMAGCRRVMLQAPTGFGKTVTAAAILRLALDKGNRAIFTVPKVNLVDQACEDFYNAGLRDFGVIQADHPMTDLSKPLQIASLATLKNRFIPQSALVLVDEAHEVHAFLADWMAREDWQKVPFVGLSATPWSRGLGKLYSRLVVAATTQQLIDRGDLSRFRMFAPSHPDLSGVSTTAGDYSTSELSARMTEKTLVADIVTTWRARAEGRPTLCFAVDRVHAKTIQQQFQAQGVACGYLDAHSTRSDRDEVRKAFASGALKVVCNVGVLTTGVDWDVRCIILARPTKSEILYTQIIGRGLRNAPGKEDCLILDHSDTALRLGFVTDIHHETLDDGARKAASKRLKPVPLPKECTNCSFLRPPKVLACPACGHVAEVTTGVKTVDGELVDMSAARRKKNRDEGWPEKIAFMRELKAFAIEHGYAPGWAAHKYHARYGVMPNDVRVRYVQPAAGVSRETRAWITSQNIRFAKRRAS